EHHGLPPCSDWPRRSTRDKIAPLPCTMPCSKRATSNWPSTSATEAIPKGAGRWTGSSAKAKLAASRGALADCRPVHRGVVLYGGSAAVEVQRDGARIVIGLTDPDMTGEPAVRDTGQRICQLVYDGARYLVLDLAHLTFVSSAGLAMFILLRKL